MIYYAFFEDNRSNDPGNIIIDSWSYDIFIMTHLASTGFASTYTVVPMYQQLKERSIKRWIIVMTISFITVIFIYIAFSISGYYLFGENIDQNILNSSYPNDIYWIVARLSMAFSIMSTFPLIFKPFISTIESNFFDSKIDYCNFEDNPCIRISVIIALDIILIGCAIFINDINPVFPISSATTIIVLSCILPCLMFWEIENSTNDYFESMKNMLEKKLYIMFLLLLFIFGFLMGLAGLAIQIYLLFL